MYYECIYFSLSPKATSNVATISLRNGVALFVIRGGLLYTSECRDGPRGLLRSAEHAENDLFLIDYMDYGAAGW